MKVKDLEGRNEDLNLTISAYLRFYFRRWGGGLLQKSVNMRRISLRRTSPQVVNAIGIVV
jgi:hypothetical protein